MIRSAGSTSQVTAVRSSPKHKHQNPRRILLREKRLTIPEIRINTPAKISRTAFNQGL